VKAKNVRAGGKNEEIEEKI